MLKAAFQNDRKFRMFGRKEKKEKRKRKSVTKKYKNFFCFKYWHVDMKLKKGFIIPKKIFNGFLLF